MTLPIIFLFATTFYYLAVLLKTQLREDKDDLNIFILFVGAIIIAVAATLTVLIIISIDIFQALQFQYENTK